MTEMPSVKIATDGACKGNPGPGGWGVLLRSEDGSEKELCGGELGTTNNRMELMAAISAFRPSYWPRRTSDSFTRSGRAAAIAYRKTGTS